MRYEKEEEEEEEDVVLVINRKNKDFCRLTHSHVYFPFPG